MVPLVLQPQEIVPTFLKFESWSLGAGFYSYYIDQNRIIVGENLSFMHTKRFNTFLKIWVQSRVGAILRLPKNGFICLFY